MNSGSERIEAKHVSGKNICWSTFIGKSKERKIFDFLHCPFEPPAKQHRPVSQLGWILWCMLARPSKGQCRNSKIFPPLLLTVKVDQNIFFPETCFASTISEPEFTVCIPCQISSLKLCNCTYSDIYSMTSRIQLRAVDYYYNMRNVDKSVKWVQEVACPILSSTAFCENDVKIL